jgi:hypothetical protein
MRDTFLYSYLQFIYTYLMAKTLKLLKIQLQQMLSTHYYADDST